MLGEEVESESRRCTMSGTELEKMCAAVVSSGVRCNSAVRCFADGAVVGTCKKEARFGLDDSVQL